MNKCFYLLASLLLPTFMGNVIASELKSSGGSFVSTKSCNQQKKMSEFTIKPEVKNENTAWRGERVNMQLLLWSAKETKITAKATKLVNKNGDILDNRNVKLNFIKAIEMNKLDRYANNPQNIVKVADMFDGSSPVNIAAGDTQRLWIGIDIPRDAKAGKYQGKIIVSIGKKEFSFEYVVNVLDLTLPEVKDWEFDLNLWTHPQAAAHYYSNCKCRGQDVSKFQHNNCDKLMWTDKHLALYKPNLELLRDAGLKTITVNLIKDPWRSSYLLKSEQHQTNYSYDAMIKWIKTKDGVLKFDFSNFEKYVKFCMNLGIDRNIECFSMLPWCGNACSAVIYYDEQQQKEVIHNFKNWEEYEVVWSQFIEKFIAVLVKNNWFEKVRIGVDERGLRNVTHVLKVLDKYKYQGKTLKLSTAVNTIHDFDDRISTIAMHGGTNRIANDKWSDQQYKKWAAERRAKGLISTWYTCTGTYPGNFGNSRPAESLFIGWYSAAIGADGYLRWAVDSWNDEPTKTTDHKLFETGDLFQIYPGDRDAKVPFVRSSVRFELLREGVVDFEKIAYLKKKYPACIEEINAMLAEIKRPKMPNRIAGNSSLQYEKETEEDFSAMLKKAEAELLRITLKNIKK